MSGNELIKYIQENNLGEFPIMVGCQGYQNTEDEETKPELNLSAMWFLSTTVAEDTLKIDWRKMMDYSLYDEECVACHYVEYVSDGSTVCRYDGKEIKPDDTCHRRKKEDVQ